MHAAVTVERGEGGIGSTKAGRAMNKKFSTHSDNLRCAPEMALRCNGKLTCKPRRMQRHQRAHPHTEQSTAEMLCSGYGVNKQLSCVLISRILIPLKTCYSINYSQKKIDVKINNYLKCKCLNYRIAIHYQIRMSVKTPQKRKKKTLIMLCSIVHCVT
jgi:hypothetical protein